MTCRALVIFSKAPVPGGVKTRLQPPLSPEQAGRLHLELLKATLGEARKSGAARTYLYTDDPRHAVFSCRPDFEGVLLREQSGLSLGERMHAALTEALREAESAVLIGSDCPEISADYIDQAFSELESNFDVVLGPAMDGGYVLIGLREANAQIFSGIDWGQATVLTQTRSRLHESSLKWVELTALRDLDRPEDLDYFGITPK